VSDPVAQQKRERTQARVGLASNVVGLGAGVAALGAAARSPVLRRRVGAYVPAKRKQITRGAKGLAVGAVGLQAANTGGDVVTNLVLQRESKRKVEKMDSVAKSDGGSVGRRIDGDVEKAVPKLPDRFDGPGDKVGTPGGQKVLQDFRALQGKTKKVGRLARVIRKDDQVDKGAGKFLGDATGLRTKKLAAGAKKLEASAVDARARAATFAPGKRQNLMAREAKSKTAAADRLETLRRASARSGNRTRAIAAGSAAGAGGLYGAGYYNSGRRRTPMDPYVEMGKARSFDPEADRQRRTGAYAGVAAGGSIVSGREAARYIKLKDAKTGAKGVFAPKGKGKQALAWGGASAGLAALSAGTYKRGVSRRNQPWN
jgi:hypothetical protein